VVPHLTTEDTVYDGYVIPRGSMLLANTKYEELFLLRRSHLTPLPPRSMLRDKRFWDEPEEFKPKRFLQELKEGQVDPKSLIFGFGRRLATQLLYLMVLGVNLKD
jgi:cytochrome P450